MTGLIQPFTENELAQLEDELRRRFDLEVNLRDYLTTQGLLCIPYTDLRLQVAEHVAVIAHELFGAVAGERGKLRDVALLRRQSERYAHQNAERMRLLAIEDGVDRVREVVRALRRRGNDPRRIPVWIAVDAMADVAAAARSDLIAALSVKSQAVRTFATRSLEHLGVAAAEAIPALTPFVRDPKSPEAYDAVCALAAMGEAAEEGLVLALNHHDRVVRFVAIRALGALREVSESALARLVQMADGKDGNEDAARTALKQLGRSR